MNRKIAAAIALAFFMLVLFSQVGNSTAQITPLPTAAAVSLLPTPLPHWEPSYNPHPPKIKPRKVPFVNEVGETIVKQIVIERPSLNPIVVNFKAQLPTSTAPQAGPLTFQSPLQLPGPFRIYMPLVSRPAAKVLVIAYIGYPPTITPTALAQSLISYIGTGTRFHGVEPTSIGFEMVGGRVEISNTRAPKRTQDNYWDMWKIYADHNICNRVNTEGINEVWVIIDGAVADPNFVRGWEWQVNGPLFSTSDATSAYPPNCGKQMYTMGFNFNDSLANALEAWVHTAEFAFSLPESGSALQSCDFGHPGFYGSYGNFSDDACNAIGYSDTSGFTVLPDYTHGYASVCGDAHYPPNIPREHAWPPLPNPYAYIYWDTTAYPSRCTDWQWNILTSTVPISCGVWGCNQGGYFVWWMQQVPGKNNNSHDRNGNLRPNWWNYRLAP